MWRYDGEHACVCESVCSAQLRRGQTFAPKMRETDGRKNRKTKQDIPSAILTH